MLQSIKKTWLTTWKVLRTERLSLAKVKAPATKLMELLAALPAQVSFSEIAPHNPEEIPDESTESS